MTEPIDTIIELANSGYFFLQSVYNDTNALSEPVPGNSYYVGYPCLGEEAAAPLPGHQPGEVYQTAGIATCENAAAAIPL